MSQVSEQILDQTSQQPQVEAPKKKEKKKLNLNAASIEIKEPEPVVEVIQQPPYYSYPEPYKKDGIMVFPKEIGQIIDQYGNWYQLESNQYLDNGQIFEWVPPEENNDQSYWDDQGNYDSSTRKIVSEGIKDSNKPLSKEEIERQRALKKQRQKVEKAEKMLQEAKGQVKGQVPGQIRKDAVSSGPKPIEKKLTDDERLKQIQNGFSKEKRYTIDELKNLEIGLTEEKKYATVDTVREPINLVFVGHVDAGKSTLSGRVLLNTGEVDETDLKNYQKDAIQNKRENWWLAYVMDINEDERAKGKTVECGKAHFKLSQRRFTLFDAPGHKNYVPNMIMGACQSDLAVLIISAKQGEFESGFEKGGQTQEHCHLVKALGIENLIVAVSKMDQIQWDQERYNQIKSTVMPFLRDQVGFKNPTWVPIDSYGDVNISGKVDSGICNWYDGPSFFEILNNCPIPKRDSSGPIRIPVLQAIKDTQTGQTFIYGKIESGCIKQEMKVCLMPKQKEFTILEIFDSKDRQVFYAYAGENVKLRIKGIEDTEIKRGSIVCNTDDFCQAAKEFQAEITIMELPESKPIVSEGFTSVMHIHTTVADVEISKVEAVWDNASKSFKVSDILRSGERGIVKFFSSQIITLEKAADVSTLGRFTLRDENKTIGFGIVTKIKPALEFQKLQQKLQQQKKAEQAKK